MANHVNATDVRDARNDRGSAEVGKPQPAKKNTKKWCRGVVGREHKMQARPYKGGRSNMQALERWQEHVCTVCGKVLDVWMPTFRAARKDVPAWVNVDLLPRS